MDVRPVAFTPIARPGQAGKGWVPADWPDIREEPYLQELAAKYERSIPQIMLNWGISRGHVVIPKATSLEHQKENADIFNFKLTENEIEAVSDLNKNIRLCNRFDDMGKHDFFA